VATGPGSFTGLRAGVSYGIGLAMGLDVPLLGLGSLELQAARARVPATALVEAGRGGCTGRRPAPGHAWASRPTCPSRSRRSGGCGRRRLRPCGRPAVALLDEGELLGFGRAAAAMAGRAEKLGYDTVKLKYLQSFRPMRE